MPFDKDSFLRNYLDLSTAHIPESDPDWGSLRVTKNDYGYVVFIGPDLDGVPDWMKEIYDFAIALNCGIINFDCDAETIDRLPSWNW